MIVSTDASCSRPTRLGPSVGRLLIGMSLLLLLYGLFQVDVPLARFIRSLEHPIGYFPNPWLFWINWIGNWVGDGLYLALFSAGLLAGGWWFSRRNLMDAGWQSLVAHGAVALLVSHTPHLFRSDVGAHGNHAFEVMDTCRPGPDTEAGDADLSRMAYLECCEHAFRDYARRHIEVDRQQHHRSAGRVAFRPQTGAARREGRERVLRACGERASSSAFGGSRSRS